MQHLPQFTMSRAQSAGNQGTCRSCDQSIAAGEVRVKIEYPTKLVIYATRTGSPSFYIHLDCLVENPVDYVKSGVKAWKSWTSISKFEIKTIKVSMKNADESVAKLLERYTNVRSVHAKHHRFML